MIFNTSIETAAWPKTWKRGIWTPVFKKDDRQGTSNYRPITALPVVGKIYEKLLSKQIQGLQILLMSGVGVTSASQILESFCNIWSRVSQRKKPFSDFPARGPRMYTLS